MGFFPPGGEMDAYTPEGYANGTLTVPAAVFLAAVEKSFPEILDAVLKRGASLRIGAAEQTRLRGLLSAVFAEVGNSAEPLVGILARKHLERVLLDTFLAALRGGCESLIPSPGRRAEGRMRRLRLARDYVMDHLHEPIQLEDLCGSVGLSRRGVELLFNDSLGIGPTAFLRHQRLHGVRCSLLTTPPARGAVRETALDWGFWHMGPFLAGIPLALRRAPKRDVGEIGYPQSRRENYNPAAGALDRLASANNERTEAGSSTDFSKSKSSPNISKN